MLKIFPVFLFAPFLFVASCGGGNTGQAFTPSSTSSPSPSRTASVDTRDPLKQPFASDSIWNMPIGRSAVYVAAHLPTNPGNSSTAKMPGIDAERIVLKPTAPLVTVNYSSAGWSGQNRCSGMGATLLQVPVPSTYVVPSSSLNNVAAFLLPDQRTIAQAQPFARCTPGGAATAMIKFANVDLHGSGIAGAHGGSGLSAIGGSIRLGELRPGNANGPRHALKINVYAKEALYQCLAPSTCFRWPASTADSYAVGTYGSNNKNSNGAVKMGALLAIPASVAISALGLETEPARQLAWTLQNYGAYIVDDTSVPGFDFNVEDGPDGSKSAEFSADWGFEMEQRVSANTAWVRDIQRIVAALYVVDNNSVTAIGGGGVRLQALAPEITP